jgi:hypothetical protein
MERARPRRVVADDAELNRKMICKLFKLRV